MTRIALHVIFQPININLPKTYKLMENESLPDHTQLSEQLTRAQRELAVLYEVSSAMRTTLELNHILYIILTGVTAHTGLGFNRAILFLINPKDRALEPKMAIGPESGEHAKNTWNYISESNQDLDDLIRREKIEDNMSHSSFYNSIKEIRIPLDSKEGNLLSSAFHQGTPLHLLKEKLDQYQDDPFLKTFQTNELVIMPLKAKDKVKGLIVADNLYTQKPITIYDLRIFMMLANQAGLAIENSQLYEIIIHKSHTDSLTELWNHGYFQDFLSKELSLSQMNHVPISLLMIDIDNFKKLNDVHGHQHGDIILKEIASILKDSSRQIDCVCRYGGEEFAIILPQTDQTQGYNIAERIRQQVEHHKFPPLTSQENFKVTVSIGLATLTDDIHKKEDLITKADKAMYIAKFSGKNQTCVA